MKEYSWREATISQLYQVAFGEEPCTEFERLAAKQEINRRKKQRHGGRVNYREKKHYR